MSIVPDHQKDVRDLAKLLISRYGEQAAAYASHQALKARQRGDPRVMEAWRWIASAIDEVLRSEPDGSAGPGDRDRR
jgi:hypothetical protein